MQLYIDSFEYRVQIAVDFRIPEADDSISFLLQPELPFAITLGYLIVIVMSAIEFDDEMFGRAEEIHDVRTDRRLPPEMRAVYR
jgi:hypothetical protein